MTDRRFIETDLNVICMVVTYDSSNLIAICSNTSDSFEVHCYSLTTFKRTFNIAFNGEFESNDDGSISETYLKVDNIEQNSLGTIYGIAYQDNGRFFITFISNKGRELDRVNVTKILNLDDESKPVTGFN